MIVDFTTVTDLDADVYTALHALPLMRSVTVINVAATPSKVAAASKRATGLRQYMLSPPRQSKNEK